MNRDPYVSAINNALTEIHKAYPDITHSFIFTNNGSIVTGGTDIDEKTLKSVLASFEVLKLKAKTIGNLKNLSINGKNGKISLSNIDDMCIGLTTTEKADQSQIHFITNAILPPLLKTLQTFGASNMQQNAPQNVPANAQPSVPSNVPQNFPQNYPANFPQNVPPHLQSPFTKTLVVDPLSGFFDGNAVQIDEETIVFWNENNESKKGKIDQVKIVTIDGNSSVCKVKKISVGNLKGKNRVRIPAKVCNQLKLKRGDVVNISPDV
jgi:predicted regulator of Ras-like GTPase activity (Roadblock/LC7/MglB family)